MAPTITRCPTAYSSSRPSPSSAMMPTGSCPSIRPGRTGILPFDDMHVGSADGRGRHANDRLASARVWARDLLDAYIVDTVEHDRLHGFHVILTSCSARHGSREQPVTATATPMPAANADTGRDFRRAMRRETRKNPRPCGRTRPLPAGPWGVAERRDRAGGFAPEAPCGAGWRARRNTQRVRGVPREWERHDAHHQGRA